MSSIHRFQTEIKDHENADGWRQDIEFATFKRNDLVWLDLECFNELCTCRIYWEKPRKSESCWFCWQHHRQRCATIRSVYKGNDEWSLVILIYKKETWLFKTTKGPPLWTRCDIMRRDVQSQHGHIRSWFFISICNFKVNALISGNFYLYVECSAVLNCPGNER